MHRVSWDTWHNKQNSGNSMRDRKKYKYTHKIACSFLVYVWILRKWRISNIQKFHQIIERKGYRRSYPSWPRSEVLSLSLSLSMLKPWLSGLKYETLVLFHAISRRGCFCHFSFYLKKKKKKFLHFYYSYFNFWAGREIFVHGWDLVGFNGFFNSI